MKSVAPFDLLETPLETGQTLIEASAGTGKTYTITALVLRLILEKGLTIDQILVSTYTELATAELRDRIRKLLEETWRGFETGTSENKLVAELLERHRGEASEMKRRLRFALASFDEAPVFTIHGFCSRVLKDSAFESGVLFDAEVIVDQSAVLREIADDFWRNHFYEGSRVIVHFVLRRLSPERFLEHLQTLVSNPTLHVIPFADEAGLAALEREIVAEWEALEKCWAKEGEDLRRDFAHAPWALRTHGDPEKMAAVLADLEACLAGSAAPDLVKCLETLSRTRIDSATRVRHTAPDRELFNICQRLFDLAPQFITTVEAAFFRWAAEEIRRRKADRNVISFDDMLTRLDGALSAPGGDGLAAAIRRRFKAALVDEFQDTDPLQYRIFQRIFEGSDALVFFIGDPKQAIYGFRGADVFTYLQAVPKTRSQYTLRDNWRSEGRLIAAVNHLFARLSDPFVIEGIDFRPARAAIDAAVAKLEVNGRSDPPFKLWLETPEKRMNKAEARKKLAGAVADEIVRLLNGNVKIDGRQIEPRDIAVLVSSHREGSHVREALGSCGVPAVVYSAENVFRSPEADQLQRILAAVAEPGREALVRGALLTEVLGVAASGLEELVRDERAWEQRLVSFQAYRELWVRKGFIQMFRTLLTREAVRPRLLGYPDGERRLTNLLHLGELLQGAASAERPGIRGLLEWLAGRRREASTIRSEDYELRLERDEDAVRVVTIHKSKGLEYGIVFCPFCWSDPRTDDARFHEDGKLTLDLEKSKEHLEEAARESLAGDMRLLYVALTRARHRCYLAWGNFSSGLNSAAARLLGSGIPGGGKSKGAGILRSEAMAAVEAAPGIEVRELPGTSGERYTPPGGRAATLEPRVFCGSIDRAWGLYSFTSLVTGREEVPATADEDHVGEESPAEPETVPTGIFAFPRGAAPGTCLHQVLEALDFSDLSNLEDVVENRLRMFGLQGFEAVVCETVRKVVAVPLDLQEPDFTLSRISDSAKLPELEFHFAVDGLTKERLAQYYAREGGFLGSDVSEFIGRLQFRPGRGLVKGFIDLVFEHEGKFFILDWKSNWLGGETSAYDREAMSQEMTRQDYHLQSHLYTVALDRYLRLRMRDYRYETHFGGSFYVFLRGIDPCRPELGIYRSRPPESFIRGLDELLRVRS